MSLAKDKQQKQQEKFQAILSGLLREEDNKYCADCEAKGPRWASWNIGIFLCIRCAGIHRNLGVHISKVKSVNLDQWTAEQITSMQAMGNSKAKSIYEFNLPENYRRSQTDSAMEQFIRGKYEARKWIDKQWSPPVLSVSSELLEDDKEKRKASDKQMIELKIKPLNSTTTVNQSKASKSKKPEVTKKEETQPSDNQPRPNENNMKEETLLDFGVSENSNKPNNEIEDLFSNMHVQTNQFQQQEQFANQEANSNSALNDLSAISNGLNLTGDLINNNVTNKFDKNSILSLYNTSNRSTNNLNNTNSISFHQPYAQKQSEIQNKPTIGLQQPTFQNEKLFGAHFQNVNQANFNFNSQPHSNQFSNLTSMNNFSNKPNSDKQTNNIDLLSFDVFADQKDKSQISSQALPTIGNFADLKNLYNK